LPIYTDPKGFVTLQIGAGAPWPNSGGATIEPLVLAGHNILKELAPQYPNLAINIFARYASEQGKAGVGIGFSYAFAAPASAS